MQIKICVRLQVKHSSHAQNSHALMTSSRFFYSPANHDIVSYMPLLLLVFKTDIFCKLHKEKQVVIQIKPYKKLKILLKIGFLGLLFEMRGSKAVFVKLYVPFDFDFKYDTKNKQIKKILEEKILLKSFFVHSFFFIWRKLHLD